jgi:hypothetical protein
MKSFIMKCVFSVALVLGSVAVYAAGQSCCGDESKPCCKEHAKCCD